jgi:hypothetical protein
MDLLTFLLAIVLPKPKRVKERNISPPAREKRESKILSEEKNSI